jgi:hypothetical protein
MSRDAGGLHAEHAVLLSAATGLSQALRDIPGQIRASAAIDYELHRTFETRLYWLGQHLAAVESLLVQHAYAACFALLRTCLEHRFVDRLLFLGRRYRRTFAEVPEDNWAQWLDAWRRQSEAWTLRVKEEPSRSKNGLVAIIFEGVPVKNAEGMPEYEISPYYLALEEHDPFLGRPSDQSYVADWTELSARRRWAESNEDVYRSHLTWRAIRDNLALNGLATSLQLRQIDVHYRFLSAFTHAHSRGYDRLRRVDTVLDQSGYDHYLSELVLLYQITIAAQEMGDLFAVLERPPTSFLDHADELRARIESASGLARHLWFPPDGPTEYDEFVRANHRRFSELRPREHDGGAGQVDDADLYYADPLTRLVQLHQSQSELVTGLRYVSPWNRPPPFGRYY